MTSARETRRKIDPFCSEHVVTQEVGSHPCRSHPPYELGLGRFARVTRREYLEIALTGVLVVIAGVCHFAGLGDVLTFVVAAIALAGLARTVGTATEQLGARLRSLGGRRRP